MTHQVIIKTLDSTSRLSAPDLEFVRIARGFTGKTQKQIISEALQLWSDAHPELQELIPSSYWMRSSNEPDAQESAE